MERVRRQVIEELAPVEEEDVAVVPTVPRIVRHDRGVPPMRNAERRSSARDESERVPVRPERLDVIEVARVRCVRVLVPHRGMTNNLSCEVDRLDLQSTDVVAQFVSFSFDASVTQLFAPLLRGAKS